MAGAMIHGKTRFPRLPRYKAGIQGEDRESAEGFFRGDTAAAKDA